MKSNDIFQLIVSPSVISSLYENLQLFSDGGQNDLGKNVLVNLFQIIDMSSLNFF